MINQKLILARIDQLGENLELMFDVKIASSYSYKYLMIQIEKKMEELLIKVKDLVKEHELGEVSFLDFKKNVIRSLHQAGMKRGEYDWANAFEKKFKI
jgi:hypothetical protein